MVIKSVRRQRAGPHAPADRRRSARCPAPPRLDPRGTRLGPCGQRCGRGGTGLGFVPRPRAFGLCRQLTWSGRSRRQEPPRAGAGRPQVSQGPPGAAAPAPGCGQPGISLRPLRWGTSLFPKGLFAESTPDPEPAARLPQAGCLLARETRAPARRCRREGQARCPPAWDLTLPAASAVWPQCRARALGQEGHLDSPDSSTAVDLGGLREPPVHSACVAPRSQCLARCAVDMRPS
ncbi:uncharacterized protein LOC115298465 [Suricata suricatta]|uniref:uncharacterized protein LOC115298465 n=1 Tax=Suricata suricatta TaxID=37032 RepID=UPI001155C123|nr:uncharacterized protein LOC115298465 [Suricata suricatta]